MGRRPRDFYSEPRQITTADNGTHPGSYAMNTSPKTRIARRAASILASLIITFTGLHLIAGYALPEPTPADTAVMAGTTTAMPR